MSILIISLECVSVKPLCGTSGWCDGRLL